MWQPGVNLQNEETGEDAKKVKCHLMKLIQKRRNASGETEETKDRNRRENEKTAQSGKMETKVSFVFYPENKKQSPRGKTPRQ